MKFTTFVRVLFGHRKGRTICTSRRCRPVVEMLEDRLAPALFAPAQNFAAGDDPIRMTVGDFNGDGIMDLATVHSSASAFVNVLLGTGNGNFITAPGSPFAVGFDARDLTSADFNGDGLSDLAVPIYSGAPGRGVRIFLATGGGQFAEAAGSPFGLPHYVESIATADFNNDGKADLVVNSREGDHFTDTVSVLLGDGAGGFGGPLNLNVGSAPYSLAVADCNRDGKQDVIVVNSFSNAIHVYLGDGAGGFGNAINSAVPLAPYRVGVGDFNHDGIVDLAVALDTPGTQDDVTQILVGDGTGAFTPAPGGASFVGGSNGIVVGDFNGDGTLDFAAVGTFSGPALAFVYLGDGNLGFTPASGNPFTVGGNPRAIVAADFDRDGRLDFATANGADDNVSILLNTLPPDVHLSFASAVNFSAGDFPTFVATADFNRDGRDDLVVANSNSNNVSIMLGNGSGGFQTAVNYGAGSGPVWVAVGDFNRDGKKDLAVANRFSGNVSILLGNGDGTFQAAVNYGAGNGPISVAIGDFNADGRFDLVVANTNGGNVSILLGNGDGTFQTAVNYAASFIPSSVAVGDFNADGKADLAVADGGSNVSVLLGNGNGTFQNAVNYPTASGATCVAIGDFNADGKPDLAVTAHDNSSVSILLGNGNGTFQTAVNYSVRPLPESIRVGDFNADGNLDLAVGTVSDVSILLGLGNGTFATAINFAASGQPYDLALGDFNRDGKTDIVTANNGGNNVSLLLNDSSPGLLIVDTLGDSDDGNPANGLTLREAIHLANDAPGGNTIQFNLGAGAHTITLSGAELAITDDLIITGPGANLLTIDGNLGSRVFNISASHTAEISGITLTRGATTAGAIRNDGSLEVADCILSGNTAGAISNVGIMTISNSTLANNSAENGGAIATNGTLTVANCTFSGNSAVNVGGAIENQGAAITTITGSSFTGNSAPSGAAIANANRLTVISSTISANQGIGIHTYTGSGTVTEVIDSTINGNAGNGIFNETGSLTVTRSTISGNQSPTGGGIFVRGNLNMVNSTVSGNSTTGGGGGGLVIQGSNNFITNSTITNNSAGFSGGMHIDSNVSLKNTIVAGNTAGSGDPNLNSNYVETGPNILSGNALLGLLQGNGGPTKTHALLSGSPAIDAGINTGAPATDQRGVSRPKGSAVDIGAFEVDPDVTTPTAALASAPTVTAANAAGNNPYLFTVTFSDNTAIDVSTLDNSDVMVSGPNSFNQAATFVSVSPSGNGTPRIATYRVTKAWLPGDNGTYTVALQSNQVKDTAGNAAAGGALGTFLVDLTAPVAALTHPPTVNIANAAGNNPYVFTVTFSDNTAIDVGTLGDSDIDVTGPNSFNQAATFDSVDVSTDGTPRVVRYRFAKTWTAADNGAYTISLQSNQVKDPASNPAAAGSLGTFLVNLTAPTAALASAPNVNAAGNPSNNPYTFMVTFSDDTAIDVGTLDNTDVVVTGPNSFNQAATFVSVSPSGTGTPRTATYQFAKAWSATDTGTYTIALQSNQVKDTAGNPAAAGSLGTFSVLRALFADNFNRNSSPTLGVPWTTPFGAFDVVAPAFDANLAYAHGITLNTNLATLAGLVVADVDLFADVNLATGAQSGLIARFVDFNNYYGATITKEPTGLFTARLVKFVGGGYTELAVFENTAASGKLRLRVFGNTLQMYFNDVLIGAAIDFSLNAGSVGMRTFGNLAQLDNFQVWPITTTIDRVDPFTQPDNTTLSDPWVQSEGYFRTINNRIQGGAAVNRAVIQAAVATDVEVRANIGITGNGHFASLLARYNGATDSWYQGTLVRDTSGTLQAYLFKRSAGVFTQIGGSASLTSVTGNVNARLLVTGGFLKLFINDVLILDGFDPALASGSAGIRSDNYAFFDDFSVRAVRTDLPFSENFNSSALNLPWATQAAPFTLSGGGAAPATGTVSLATLAGVNAANAEVQADIAITNTGGVGSLVLGYNGPGNANYYTAVVYRQPGNIPATPFSLYLFRNDAGNYVQLGAEIKVATITGPIQFRLAGNQLTFLMNSVVQITAADNTYTGGSVGIRGFVNGANAGTVTIDNFSASNLNFVPFNDSFTAATLDPNWQIRAGGFTSTAAGNVGKAKGTTASNHMTLGRLDLADVDVNATINVPNISGNYVNLTVRVSSGADPDFYLASVYWTGSQFNADIFKKIGATFVQLGTSTIGSGAGVLRFTAVGGQLKLYFGGVAKLSVVDFSLRSGSVGVRSPLDPTFDDFTVAQG